MSVEFDESYFERFYRNPATRVADNSYFQRLASFIAAYLKLADCRPRTILDAGCGLGLLHPTLRQEFPGVVIDAFDVSAYTCRTYGWRQDSLTTFEVGTPNDLVICHDVIQYLNRNDAVEAINRLSAATRNAMFLGVLTEEDWNENCDQTLTDGDAFLRSARWYRRQLEPQFVNAGGGMWFKRDADIVLYALESC